MTSFQGRLNTLLYNIRTWVWHRPLSGEPIKVNILRSVHVLPSLHRSVYTGTTEKEISEYHQPESKGSTQLYQYYNLLPTRSEERGVLRVGSIPVAILPSCQNILDCNCIFMNI